MTLLEIGEDAVAVLLRNARPRACKLDTLPPRFDASEDRVRAGVSLHLALVHRRSRV